MSFGFDIDAAKAAHAELQAKERDEALNAMHKEVLAGITALRTEVSELKAKLLTKGKAAE